MARPSVLEHIRRVALALSIVGILAPCAQADEKIVLSGASLSQTVQIGNFTFSPAEIDVAPNTTVTWVNSDDIPHTVVSTNQAFRSKPMDTDQQFSFTFKAPGIYEYFCSLHPHMKGKVIVK